MGSDFLPKTGKWDTVTTEIKGKQLKKKKSYKLVRKSQKPTTVHEKVIQIVNQ